MSSRELKLERDVDEILNGPGYHSDDSPLPVGILKKPPLTINLLNIEDPQFADSQYVLTSPRSLGACERLEVKPVELLHKPLFEFEDELLHKGISKTTVFTLYDQYEIERLGKLSRCREEREKIIKDEGDFGYESPASDIITCGGIGDKDWTVPVRDVEPQDAHTDSNHIELVNTDPASLQRKRTAWATSIGHERVTQDDLEKRAKEIHTEGKIQREKLLSKPRKPRFKTSTAHTAAKTAAKNKQRKPRPDRERNSSHSDLSVTSSSNGNGRVPWLRDPRTEAKPITDPRLRTRLLSAKGSKITSKDQKILERMLDKREDEQREREEQVQVEAMIQQEKELTEYQKTSTERRQRKSLGHERLEREKRRLAVEARRRSDQEEADREKEKLVRQQQQHADELKQRQDRLKERKILEQQRKARERKKSQEECLTHHLNEEEEFKRKVIERQEVILQRAQSIKEAREQELKKQLKMKHVNSKKEHEERLNKVKRQSTDNLENLRFAMNMRHSVVQSNHDLRRQRKEQELRKSQRDLDKRIKKSKILQNKMTDEMEAWHDEIVSYRKQSEKRAEEIAKTQTEEKARKAAKERRLKEQLQKEHMQKLLEQEEEYKQDLEAHLALKEAHTQAVMRDKEEAIGECRAMAQTSERLREELRRQFNTTKIRDMNQKAQIESRLGGGMHSATKNMSTLTLG